MNRRPATPEQNAELAEDVARLLNGRSRENVSDTPDWLAARIMVDALVAFESVTNRRDEWSGFSGLSERLSASLGESPELAASEPRVASKAPARPDQPNPRENRAMEINEQQRAVLQFLDNGHWSDREEVVGDVGGLIAREKANEVLGVLVHYGLLEQRSAEDAGGDPRGGPMIAVTHKGRQIVDAGRT